MSRSAPMMSHGEGEEGEAMAVDLSQIVNVNSPFLGDVFPLFLFRFLHLLHRQRAHDARRFRHGVKLDGEPRRAAGDVAVAGQSSAGRAGRLLGRGHRHFRLLRHLGVLSEDKPLGKDSAGNFPRFLRSRWLNKNIINFPEITQQYSCLEGERISLLQFKKSLIDRSNRLSSWTGLDCCKWEGVSCSSTTSHVLELDLHNLPTYDVTVPVSSGIASFYCNNCLEGEINQSLINLTHLDYLDLSSNNFSGINIPEFLESFKSLKYLNLSSSGFVGSIPTHLRNLSSLEYLDLGNVDAPIVYNNLATNNLEWLFGLSSLKTLDISQISIGHSENWLNTINKLKFLSSLNLASCNLGTTNPLSHVNSTTSLVWLNLEWNHLDSTIFLWLSNVTRLEHLSLAGNDINSDFPDMFEHLASLKVVDLGWNAFTGTITPLCKIHNLIDMKLNRNDFQGLIPNCLGNLTSLITLELSYNQFEGSIPNSLSNLCRLEVLDLRGNTLTYLTTVLSGCLLSSLKTLYLEENNFSGQLPKWLYEYRNLKSLSLSSNFFSGTIAESLGNLSTLQFLLIDGNEFSGSVPLNLGELSNLERLDISSNSFTGVLSEFHFSKLNKLDSLKISGNLFVWNVSSNWIPPFQLRFIEMDSIRMGPDFPHWLRTQRNLPILSMRNASITNAIPDWFWDFFWNCTGIYLSQNAISGDLPTKPHVGVESYMKASVEYLFLSKNQLTGEIPKWLCNLKDLVQLDLSTNKLSGEIPLCFGKLHNLIVLDLGNNILSGHIPNSLGSLYLLESLHLRNNKLEGEVPSSLQNLGSSLKFLDLSENEFTDVIQPWIGEKLSKMRFLILHANHFYGDIPLQLCQLQNLQLLNLANNNMSGYIPHCFDNLTGMITERNLDYGYYPSYYSKVYGDEIFEDIKGLKLQYNKTLPFLRSIDLSGNHLVGMIPVELTSLHALINLNLSGNHLSGTIPASIGNLSNIESLDLSRNQLSGRIPPSLSALNFMSYLNLSFNNLYGRIPSGNQLQTLNEPSAYIGNEGLCGAPLKSCDPSPKAHSVDQPTETSCDNHEFFMWFYAGLGPGFFVGFIGVLSILLFKTSWRYAYFKFLEIAYNNILHKIFIRG
nr:receptor-like protein EIX2 [Ipomoea batatas]